MRRSDLLRAAVLATATALAVSSCERKLESLECPCVSGYECCTLDNKCYRPGQGCSDESDGGAGDAGTSAGASAANGASAASGFGGASSAGEAGAGGTGDGANAGGFANRGASEGGVANDDAGGRGGNEQQGQAGAMDEPVVPAGQFPSYCSTSGWCGAKNTFQAAWGTPESGIWVGSNDRDELATSSLSRWDGERWVNFDRERAAWGRLLAIGGSGPDDVWFAGEDSGFAWFEHWDGTAFVRTPYDDAVSIRGIWGSAPDDIWAVGARGYALHFDGTGWSTELSPDFANDLNAVWGSAPDDVIAVGSNGVVARWNGEAWSVERAGPGPDLTSLWGSAPNDVWAVGVDATVLHFDGEGWTEVDIALPELDGVEFVGVTGTSARDVWLSERGGRLVHFDGEDFQARATSSRSVQAVAAAGQGEVWAFGELAFSARCSRASCLESNPVTEEDLFATWGRAANDGWAAGDHGVILQFDGAAWKLVDSPTTAQLRAMHGAGERVWAVGDVVLRYEDGAWSIEDDLETPPLHAVFAFGADDVWIGGEGSALRHFDGQQWVSFDPAGSVETITGIWGNAPDDVWAVGAGGVNLHYDGTKWTKISTPGDFVYDVQVISGTSENNVFIHGWYLDQGVPSFGAGSWDGRSWTFEGGDYGEGITAFGKPGSWAFGPRDVWVVSGSDLGTSLILRLGGSFRTEFAGTDHSLHAVWGASEHDSWAVGAEGTLLTKDFSSLL